jgi:hypothetical protein
MESDFCKILNRWFVVSERAKQTWDGKVLKSGMFCTRRKGGGVMFAPGKGECVDTDDWQHGERRREPHRG